MTPSVATDETFELAEGPFWDPHLQQLLWVDIPKGEVIRGAFDASGLISVLERVSFPGTVGAVAASIDGAWIVAGAKELMIRADSGRVTTGPRILPVEAAARLNDGKPDPAGRFVVGSLAFEDDPTAERLVVVQPNGRVEQLDADLTLSNGLGWSADGTRMYSVDTLRKTVFWRSYDVASGTAGPRAVLLTVDDGFPDGMCMDADDHLWIAIWGSGEVRRYSPDGLLVEVIRVPAPHTSCVAFAGPELETLVITTATQDLTDEQLVAHPLSGRLFTVVPGVRGQPQALWSGLPSPSRSTEDAS